eukprot:1147146-Pelagomonas_calceolata.AAC.18
MEGTRGSRISSSRIRHRKRKVTPRMYSLGCWRLFRRFWQIRIWRGRMQHTWDSQQVEVYIRLAKCPVLQSVH